MYEITISWKWGLKIDFRSWKLPLVLENLDSCHRCTLSGGYSGKARQDFSCDE